jgi:C4-type Zn-finger protein
MGVLADILNALDRWPEWKKVKETPARVDELEKRIAALESRPERAPGEACPKCRAYKFHVEKSAAAPGHFGQMGMRQYHWLCDECGYTDQRVDGKTT